ncbi:hypothetical protein AAVH_13490 [Aphelenchoides avenae]|nr:hypothetical protein AAVH_13490 [Aphelenchus avenae]
MTAVAPEPDYQPEFQDDSDPQSPEATHAATQTPEAMNATTQTVKRPSRRKATGVLPSYSAVKTMSQVHNVVANGANVVSRGLVQLWRLFQPRFTLSWHLYKCCSDRLYNDPQKVVVEEDGIVLRVKMCDLCAVANMAMTDIYRDNFQLEKKKP